MCHDKKIKSSSEPQSASTVVSSGLQGTEAGGLQQKNKNKNRPSGTTQHETDKHCQALRRPERESVANTATKAETQQLSVRCG